MANITITTGTKTAIQSLIQGREKRLQVYSEKSSNTQFQGTFIFDVTGSMFKYFEVCRKNISNITSEIQKQIPASEFSIGYFRNHGDEEDYKNIFSLSSFLGNEKKISSVMSKITKGGGGNDGKCCVEECLQSSTRLPWGAGAGKALVMVVDTYPRGIKGITGPCFNHISWSDEVDTLRKVGVKIYCVFTGDNDEVKDFYQKISNRTGGRLIPLSDIHLMTEILVGIAMKETGNLEKYIKSQEVARKITRNQEQVLLLLK